MDSKHNIQWAFVRLVLACTVGTVFAVAAACSSASTADSSVGCQTGTIVCQGAQSGQTLKYCKNVDNACTYIVGFGSGISAGAQEFTCQSCADLATCQSAAVAYCQESIDAGIDSGGGTTTCTPGTCTCLNSPGPYGCGNMCYGTADAALHACILNYGLDTCTHCVGSSSPPACGSGLNCTTAAITGSSVCTDGPHPNGWNCCPAGEQISNNACVP